MENNGKKRISRRARLVQLAHALVPCSMRDVYFTGSESFQQISILPFKNGDYSDIAPEQLLILARAKGLSSLTHRSKV